MRRSGATSSTTSPVPTRCSRCTAFGLHHLHQTRSAFYAPSFMFSMGATRSGGKMTTGGHSLPEQQLELLRGIANAFALAKGPGDAAVLTARWSKAAVEGAAHPRLYLVESAITACRDVPRSVDFRQERRAMVRQVDPGVVLDPGRKDRGVVAFPLTRHGSFLGMLEVEGSIRALESALPVLEFVATHAGAALGNLLVLARYVDDLDALDEAVGLSSDLTDAGNPDRAVRAIVAFIQKRLLVPVAVWTEVSEDGPLRLLTVRGLGSGGRRRLQRTVGTLPRWSTMGEEARRSIGRCFAAVAGRQEPPRVLDAGAALLLFPEPDACDAETCDRVLSVLGGAVEHLFTAERAARQQEQLDLGLALTAHELRGPILGVKAALESVQHLDDDGTQEGEQAVIARSRRELGQLANMTDDLLRWSTARHSLEFERVNVVDLVREAVASLRLRALGAERIRIRADGPVSALVSPDHVRSAITDLVRNALAYSPDGTDVDVAVRISGIRVVVSVRDAGPGVADNEREVIFDPFVRGRAARTEGHGLGLYFARSVAEAHGGSLGLESSSSGTTFFMSLPDVDEGRLVSAS